MDVEVGEKVRFKFGTKKEMKEGTVQQVFPKRVYLRVAFGDKSKTVVRKKYDLHPL